MSKAASTADFLPTTIRAAMARAPRKGTGLGGRPPRRKSENNLPRGEWGEGGSPGTTNNYVAETRPVGAPKGNRNALRHGRRSAAVVAHLRLLQLIARK